MYTLGVSHSNRWMICQAAPRMASLSPSIEQDVNTSRNEGLDGHHVAELVLKSMAYQLRVSSSVSNYRMVRSLRLTMRSLSVCTFKTF